MLPEQPAASSMAARLDAHPVDHGRCARRHRTDLQDDPQPASILAFAPTPAALDRLWKLRCQHSDERAVALRAELDTALAACVRGNGAWLESRLRAADPAHEPVEALVYLLLHLEDGAEIWRRLRDDVILPRAGGAGDRAIAYCAFQFRDRTMIGWLRQHPLGAQTAARARRGARPSPPQPSADRRRRSRAAGGDRRGPRSGWPAPTASAAR